MRIWVVLVGLAIASGTASATCQPACVGGGGPAATDCFLAWGGITMPATTCVDGTACDGDGRADGACTFAVEACANVAGLGTCTPAPLSAPPAVKGRDAAAQALTAALAGLDPAGVACATVALRVPLKVSLAGIKPGVSKLKVTAPAGGKRDTDRLKLVCQPNPTAPSLAQTVQPILTAKCAIPACHTGPAPSAGQTLDEGQTYAANVGVRSTNTAKLLRVRPGSLRKSYMARKILGQGIGVTAFMPQGCPGFPPSGGCLTDEEVFVILSWMANGAPNN